MLEAPIPEDEVARLAALRRLSILDTPPEPDLDGITETMARVMDVPIALITLVDGERQWFKSRYGLEPQETPRSISFCGHATTSGEPLVVADASKDPRFLDNPLVVGEPNIRFYAGVPLRSPDGYAIGTLCIIDREPRILRAHELAVLEMLAECLEGHLQIRARMITVEHSADSVQRSFAMAIHDLKTPLTGVLAGGQLLRSEHHDDQLVEDIVEAGRQMHVIILDILDVLVLPTGYQPIRSKVSPRDVVEAAVRATRRAAEGSGRKVTQQVDDGLPLLQADREALVRMLVNLISNGIKFAPRTTTVRVRATMTDQDILFSVEDDGPGVPMVHRDKVFQPFFRGTGNSRAGHGLGLASCAHAARAHGGSVSVGDAPGGGARFVARIPLQAD